MREICGAVCACACDTVSEYSCIRHVRRSIRVINARASPDSGEDVGLVPWRHQTAVMVMVRKLYIFMVQDG